MDLLELRDLCWRPPGTETLVLNGVSLTLGAGESVAIVGASGSGKSTVLRCITHLEPFERGEVTWRGDVVTAENVRRFRSKVVLVQQTPTAVGVTVQDNLLFALRNAADDADHKQTELMRRVGLGTLDLSRPFDRLSVGERQRVCLVRALTLDPDVLLLDEPTSALDTDNAAMVETITHSWRAESPERSAVWITHDEQQAHRVADRVLRLRDGTLEAVDE